MKVNYDFVPEDVSFLCKQKSDILSYAGKLLELVGSETVIVTLDSENKPFVLDTPDRLLNVLDL